MVHTTLHHCDVILHYFIVHMVIYESMNMLNDVVCCVSLIPRPLKALSYDLFQNSRESLTTTRTDTRTLVLAGGLTDLLFLLGGPFFCQYLTHQI